MKAKKQQKILKSLCLHCVFFRAHKSKYPDFNGKNPDKNSEAFHDLVGSTINIAGEIFTMLDEKERMSFFEKVNEFVESQAMIKKMQEGGSITFREFLERMGLKPAGPAKH